MAPAWKGYFQSFCADGVTCVCVRLCLMIAGFAVLALGVYRLPSIATTQGEVITGVILSLGVALQILVAAVRCPPVRGCR